MIRPQEIEEKSGQLGVPISAIERDYAQNWILKHLRAIDMVLKVTYQSSSSVNKIHFHAFIWHAYPIVFQIAFHEFRLCLTVYDQRPTSYEPHFSENYRLQTCSNRTNTCVTECK